MSGVLLFMPRADILERFVPPAQGQKAIPGPNRYLAAQRFLYLRPLPHG
jgi:hypothetical protein